MPPTPELTFALFVSSVEGRTVSRFGTATARQANELIGARRSPGGPIVWDPEEVVALPVREVEAFAKEYRDAIAEGSLRKRIEADYLAWIAAQTKRGEEADAKAKADAQPETKPAEAPEASSSAAPSK